MLENINVGTGTELPPGFNWIAVLKDIVAGAHVTFMDHITLLDLASNWPTCACGQLCKNLPKNRDGGPADIILALNGVEFYKHVSKMNWNDALHTFYKIEERTMELLEEEEKC